MGEARTYKLQPDTAYTIASGGGQEIEFSTDSEGLHVEDDAAAQAAIEGAFPEAKVVEREDLEADPDKVSLYKDEAGEWRWRRIAPNGEEVGAASEGYERKKDARDNAERMNPGLEVEG